MKTTSLFVTIVLIIGVLGCGLFSGSGSDGEIVLPATDVGTPEGDKVTKDIGPEGGTLASPDGRLTLTVPVGSLTERVAFGIQPITNKVDNGLGLAYRLEPDGKTFTTPLNISIRFDEHDLEGTVPEVLALAYQDKRGVWHEVKAMSQTEDTLSVATNHFSDWSFLARMRLDPAKATVRVGKTVYIALIGCAQPELTVADRFRKFVFGDKGNTYDDPDLHCKFGTLAKVPYDWYVDIGIIGSGENPVKYTAPPVKPSPNVATVVFPYHVQDNSTFFDRPETRKGMFTSRITIVDRGYRATGQDGPVVYSGVICSLERPFEVTGKHPIFSFPFKFVPSSPTAGTMSYSVSASVMRASGSGTYTVEGAETDSPRIVIDTKSTATIPVITTSGGGTATIRLVPLETDECP